MNSPFEWWIMVMMTLLLIPPPLFWAELLISAAPLVTVAREMLAGPRPPRQPPGRRVIVETLGQKGERDGVVFGLGLGHGRSRFAPRSVRPHSRDSSADRPASRQAATIAPPAFRVFMVRNAARAPHFLTVAAAAGHLFIKGAPDSDVLGLKNRLAEFARASVVGRHCSIAP